MNDTSIDPRDMNNNRKENNASFDPDVTIAGQRTRKKRGDLQVGDVVLNRYELLEKLGSGAMGVVFKCRDQVSQVEYALKMVPPELARDSDAMEDVRENFQLIHGLKHPNIASVDFLDRDEYGSYFLIMEYAQGITLSQWIKRKWRAGRPEQSEVISIVKQIASALDYAHKKHVLHRDIKPTNIVVGSDGEVKVLDFGLASQVRSTMTAMSINPTNTSGTPNYLSPEQFKGRYPTPASDQYALGVLTYQMLSGHLPFESEDCNILRSVVVSETPEPIVALSDSINQSLQKVLSKNPQMRYITCSEFISDIERKAGLKEEGKEDTNLSISDNGSYHEKKTDNETLIKRASILVEQQEWDKARGYCEKLLDSEPENPELYLMLCMIEHKVPSETMLAKSDCKLKEDKNFSIAVKFASEEQKKELLSIQEENIVNFYLKKIIFDSDVSEISRLSHCSIPLIKNADFQMAIKCASAGLRQKLLCIQNEQPEFFLRECMKTNNVSTEEELPHCASPLYEDSNFLMAIQCSSHERQQEIIHLAEEQSNLYLKKCMASYCVPSELNLSHCSKPLGNDFNFQLAIRCCPSNNRKKELQKIQYKQNVFFFFHNFTVSREIWIFVCVTLLLVVILYFYLKNGDPYGADKKIEKTRMKMDYSADSSSLPRVPPNTEKPVSPISPLITPIPVDSSKPWKGSR